MTQLTEVQKEAVRNGAMNALAHVSEAETDGFIASMREARSGTKALASLPEPLREMITGDAIEPEGYEHPAGDTMQDYVAAALDALAAGAPELIEPFATGVMHACEAVAATVKGVSQKEQVALDEVRAALQR